MNKTNIVLQFIVFIILGWLSTCQVLYAQQVSGTVTNSQTGAPLVGVNILVVGTSTGTTTDVDGHYSLSVPSRNDSLRFSYIGFQTKTVPISGRSTINISLKPTVLSGQQMVVIGYGKKEKGKITNAVSSISAEEFNKGNIIHPLGLLQGKVAGLSITSPGSNPYSGYTIRLRGISTFSGGNPLIVVNGMIGANLNSVDPNDIKSIDVLKDAAASAIYGSRGANGVILITTKKGIAGKPQIEYSGYVSVEEPARSIPLMTADEYRELNGTTDFGHSTDWYDEITRKAITQAHSLAISGGGQQSTYRVSLNYRDAQGILLNSGFDSFNGRVNLSQKALNNRLSLSLNLTGTIKNAKRAYGQAFRFATIYNPTAPVRSADPVYDEYGGYFQQTLGGGYYNPVAVIEQNTGRARSNLLTINLQGEFEPIDGIKISAHYGQHRYLDEESDYSSRKSYYVGINRNGLASKGERHHNNQLFETTVTYKGEFDNFGIKGLVGYSYQNFINSGFVAEGGGFITDAFLYNNLGAAFDFTNGQSNVDSYKTSYNIIGFFARLNLSYDNTYILNASLRREGSSKFGRGNKWGTFPSISAGVVLSELMDLSGYLKLRASFGIAGNTPNKPYLPIAKLNPIGHFYYKGRWITSYGPSSNPNPDLHWEKEKSFDIGIDFSIISNRLTGSLDYYHRKTSELLYPISVPVPPNLVETTVKNIGEIKSSGLEAEFDYHIIHKKRFSWMAGINGTYYLKNKLVELTGNLDKRRITSYMGPPGQNYIPVTVVKEGGPLGLIWGRVFEGVNKDTGEWIFKDLNNDDMIDNQDETVIGNGLPDFQFGFSSNFKFNNFNLRFLLQGTFGHDLVNKLRAWYEDKANATSYNIVKTKYYIPYLTDVPRFNSYYVENASFLKLKNVTLGYTLPESISKYFSELRIYVTGQNLFVITGYTGVDPVPRIANALAAGVESSTTWFTSCSYTVGIKFRF